ncbi:MAG: NADH-quinone oxidoreductase subunit J [Gemmatimonadaceae bacterium]
MPEVDYPLIYTFHFYLFGIVAVASALAFVTRRSPVAAALWLVNTMFSLAALFVMLDAQFVGVIQVLVYAGAIMVVFLFVIMLLNLGQPSELADARGLPWKLAGSAIGVALLAEIFALTRSRTPVGITLRPESLADVAATQGAVGSVASLLFTDYLLAFEVTSVLLLAAVVGAVVLGRRADAR